MIKKIVCFLLLTLFIFCSKNDEKVSLSVYFWKTNFKLTDAETSFLKDNSVQKIYTRYFDIGLKNEKPIPISPIDFKEKQYNNYEIIPVVFIKNSVFKNKSISVKNLAKKTANYIKQINTKHNIKVNEIQIDCDWSLSTKEKYFGFLKELKKLTDKILSVTIRLHQVKYYQKTGIPPVDKGVLMYYNMGDLFSLNENSIYNSKTANKYIKSLKNYPFYVDVAIPIFSWGVQMRENRIVSVVGGMRTIDIKNLQNIKKLGNNKYLITEETVFKGRVFQKNDIIKIEEILKSGLKNIIKEIKENYKVKPKNIILYDLQESNIKAYEKDIFKTICKDI